MTKIRRKGVALVESSKGILLVAGRSKKFTLPGGGAGKGESRKKAAIRELHEETGLQATNAKYLFSYTGKQWVTHSGSLVRNHAKVFLIEAIGYCHPRHEIKYVTWYKPNSKINISQRTRDILDRYFGM